MSAPSSPSPQNGSEANIPEKSESLNLVGSSQAVIAPSPPLKSRAASIATAPSKKVSMPTISPPKETTRKPSMKTSSTGEGLRKASSFAPEKPLNHRSKSNIEQRKKSFRAFKRQSSIRKNSVTCNLFKTNESTEDDTQNTVASPEAPIRYLPPFRRNFRYFGYPDNLNLEMNTPPRVRSWGPIEEPIPRIKPKHPPFTPVPDEQFDPFWTGRTLKGWTIKENPALLPVLQKHKGVKNLGRKPMRMVMPDLEFTSCPSELYFPLSTRSRKAFCRINKIVQESVDKQIRAFNVQNPTAVKDKTAQEEVKKSELNRKSTRFDLIASEDFKKSRAASRPFMGDLQEDLFYSNSQAGISPVMRSFCLPEEFPGTNRQLYGRPEELAKDYVEKVARKFDEMPITGIARIPQHQSNIPHDIWEKLSRTRGAKERRKPEQAKDKKFLLFNQLELRNQVLQAAKDTFLNEIKKDISSPLPPELFEDNRGKPQPPHDFSQGEFPPQGPFWWKLEHEKPASEEEQLIIEAYIEELKEHHIFSHHLPGNAHTPRHPFNQVELDWLEEGTELTGFEKPRKTPTSLHDMPAFVMNMEAKQFDERFAKILHEGQKDLLGPNLYEMFMQTHGKPRHKSVAASSADVTKKKSVVPEQRRRKSSKLPKPQPPPHHSPIFSDDSGEGEGEVEEEEEEEEEEQEYRLEEDLQEEESLPLPNVRFSNVDFPCENIPEGLKEEIKYFKKEMERNMPIRKDDDEPKEESSASSTTDEEDEDDEAAQEALSQIMNPEALLSKHKGLNRNAKMSTEPEQLGLKDVFVKAHFTHDIDHLLKQVEDNEEFITLII